MNLDDFKRSVAEAAPPAGMSLALQALWYDAKGDWDRAHRLSQQDTGREGAWVHAYLHRKEGDEGNASYWYSRAGRALARSPLHEEWADIVQALLRRPG